MSTLAQRLITLYRRLGPLKSEARLKELTEIESLLQKSEDDPRSRLLWLMVLTRDQIELRDLEAAEELLARIENEIPENQRNEYLSELLRLRSVTLQRRGKNDEAFQLLVKSYTAGQSNEDHWSLAHTSLNLGAISANSGDYDGASVYLKRCLEHVDLGETEPSLRAHAHLVLSQAQLERGAMDEAHYHATQAMLQYRDLSNASLAASAAALLASVHLERGELQNARTAIEGIPVSLSPAQLISVYNLDAKLNCLEGNFDAALKRHDEAIGLSSEISTERLRTNSIQLKCETLLQMEQADAALDLLESLGNLTKGYDLLSLHELKGKALEQLGRYQEALDEQKKFSSLQKELLSERASNALSRLRAAQEVLQAEREAAHFRERSQFYAKELSQRTSYLVQQNEHVNEVIRHIESLIRERPQTVDLLKDIRKKLRSLPAASFDWDEYLRLFDEIHPNALTILTQRHPDLTPTESRICSLVLAKLSNLDIARLLACSERTVENHRYRLRKKLGLSVDVDLTAFLEQTLSDRSAVQPSLKTPATQ